MPGWVAGGMIVGGLIAGEGAKSAARTGAAGQEAGIRETRRQYDQTRQDLSPYRRVATGDPIYETDPNTGEKVIDPATGLPKVTGYTGGALQRLGAYGESNVSEGDYVPGVTPFDFNINNYKDPGYDFRVSEAERALNRNAAGMGKLLSGNRLRAIMDLNQEMASQEYGAARGRAKEDYALNVLDPYSRGVGAYGRAYGREADYLNRESNLANIGQTSATDIGRFGANAASNISNMQQNIGNFNASGTLGQYGAYSKAFGDLGRIGMDYYRNQQSPGVGRPYQSYRNPNVTGDAAYPAYSGL